MGVGLEGALRALFLFQLRNFCGYGFSLFVHLLVCNMTCTVKSVNKLLVFLMVLSLHIGFMAFTALQIYDSSVLKIAIRIFAFALGLVVLSLARKDILFLFIWFFVFLCLYLFSENTLIFNFVFMVLFAYVASCFSVEDFPEIIFLVSIIGALVHAASYLTGHAGGDVVIVGDRFRMTLGFSNPNMLALNYYSMLLSGFFLLYFKRGKWSVFLFLLSVLISFPVIFVSDSRTFLFSIFVFIVLWMSIKMKSLVMLSRGFVAILPFVGAAVSLVISGMNGGYLDEVLSNRPSFFYQYISRMDEIGLLFGWATSVDDTIDNAYLLLFGALGAVLMLFVLFFVGFKMLKVDRFYLPFLAAILVLSVFESALLRPEIPLALIFLILIFSKRKNIKPLKIDFTV